MSIAILETRDGSITLEERGPDQGVAVLDLPLTRICAATLRAILETGSLHTLSLAGTHFSTSQLTEADQYELRNLSALSVNGSHLSADDLKQLVPLMGRLKFLDVSGAEFDSDVMTAFDMSSGSLERLFLGWQRTSKYHRFPPARLHNTDLDKIAEISGLKELSVRGIADGAALQSLSALKRLRVLDCGETELTNSILTQLLSALRLEALYADGCQLNDSASSIPWSTALRHLDLSFNSTGDQIVVGISTLQELRSLSLRATFLTDTGLELLKKVPLLETLDVSNTRVSSQGLQKFLSASENLRHLSILNVPVNAAAISTFGQLDSLKISAAGTADVFATLSGLSAKIDLSTSWTGEDVTFPATLYSLTANGMPTDLTRDRLMAHEELQKLSLSNVGQDVFDKLSIGHLPKLRELLAEDGALKSRHIAVLAHLPRLEALFISRNSIDDVGLHALRDHPYLHTLELRNTLISNDAIETIVSLSRLHCLDVPNTNIDQVGIREICNAPLLQSLALDPSQIGPVSIPALAQKSGLQEIYLYGLPSMKQIKLLAELHDLREIAIFDGEFTLKHADIFSEFPRLRHVRGAGITSEFRNAMEKLRPDIAINGSFSTGLSVGNGVSSGRSLQRETKAGRGISTLGYQLCFGAE